MPKYKKRKKSSYSYRKKKNAARRKAYRPKRRQKKKLNNGGHARLLRPQYYTSTGYRPFIKATAVYTGSGSITPTAGVYSTVAYRGNSPYDPVVALGGSTAQNWAQIQALGKFYLCYASSCQIRIRNSSAGTTAGNYNPASIALWASIYNAFPSVSADKIRSAALTSANMVTKSLSPIGSGARYQVLRMCRKTRTMLPLSSKANLYADLTSGADPADVWYWLIHPYDAIGSEDTTYVVQYEIVIKYYCMIYNLENVGLN